MYSISAAVEYEERGCTTANMFAEVHIPETKLMFDLLTDLRNPDSEVVAKAMPDNINKQTRDELEDSKWDVRFESWYSVEELIEIQEKYYDSEHLRHGMSEIAGIIEMMLEINQSLNRKARLLLWVT